MFCNLLSLAGALFLWDARLYQASRQHNLGLSFSRFKGNNCMAENIAYQAVSKHGLIFRYFLSDTAYSGIKIFQSFTNLK